MKDRGSIVLVVNNKVAVIKREFEDKVYYVFPGGGIEKGETPQEAAQREAYEKLGLHVIVGECIAEIAHNGIQYYFAARVIDGEFGTGKGAEFCNRGRGSYTPEWMEIDNLSIVDMRPPELVGVIQTYGDYYSKRNK
ncbi:NUDIX hydrolase [Oceanobacillus sp. 1P07AA]|uniref:NUDIX hydrolase n=1 Tax=Oceanobacillus sp. 1P07AA TaxID=3132293 RepID=UPI0039A4F7B7